MDGSDISNVGVIHKNVNHEIFLILSSILLRMTMTKPLNHFIAYFKQFRRFLFDKS